MKPFEIYGVKKALTVSLVLTALAFLASSAFAALYAIFDLDGWVLFPLVLMWLASFYLAYFSFAKAYFPYTKYKGMEGNKAKAILTRIDRIQGKVSYVPMAEIRKEDGSIRNFVLKGAFDRHFIDSYDEGDEIIVFLTDSEEALLLEENR